MVYVKLKSEVCKMEKLEEFNSFKLESSTLSFKVSFEVGKTGLRLKDFLVKKIKFSWSDFDVVA